jgi:hypothetical protein
MTVFLLIFKRDRDRRVQKRPRKNHHQRDFLSLRPSLSIFVRTLLDATVTVTLQNQKKQCKVKILATYNEFYSKSFSQDSSFELTIYQVSFMIILNSIMYRKHSRIRNIYFKFTKMLLNP